MKPRKWEIQANDRSTAEMLARAHEHLDALAEARDERDWEAAGRILRALLAWAGALERSAAGAASERRHALTGVAGLPEVETVRHLQREDVYPHEGRHGD